MKEMYKGKVNSPATLLAETIDSSVTSIKVADGTVFPEGPNIAVIGTDGNAETIKYESVNGNILVGCVRGFQGKASVWDKDTIIARNFTEYDLDALQENILELDKKHLKDFQEDENHRLVTDTEKKKWNDKVSQSQITSDANATGSDKVWNVDVIKKQFGDFGEELDEKVDKSNITDSYYGNNSSLVLSQKGAYELSENLQQMVMSNINFLDRKIPTKLSQLTNDKTFKTETEIQELINNSTKLKKEVVTSLPSTGKDDVIYLLKNKNDTNNYYTEYMWISGRWEIIGDTKVDLSDYLKTKDLKNAKLRTNKNSIHVFTDRSKSETDLDIILGDLELRTEENKKNIKTKLSEMTEDSTHRLVTDSEKEKWNTRLEKASQSEAETATNDTKYMTPLRTKDAILKLAPKQELKEVVVPIVSDTKNKNGQEVTFWTDGKMVFYFIQLDIAESDSNVIVFKATIPVGFRGKKLKTIPQIPLPVRCYNTSLTSSVAVTFNTLSIYVEDVNNKSRTVHYFGFYPLNNEE